MRRVIAGALLAVAAAGCGGADEPVAAPGTVPTSSAAVRTTPAPTTVAPTTVAPTRTSPAATRPPVTVDAPCPYADAMTMAGTVGQRIARTTVTRTTPHPGCAYYRANGEKAADIAVSVLAGPAAARARALALAGRSANPVEGVGDGGAVVLTEGGALLAVSQGATLVVVRINQSISLSAVEVAKLVVAKL